MTKNNSAYDFIINEDDELLLLLYEKSGTPENPFIEINTEEKTAVLYRTQDSGITINDFPDDAFDTLCGLEKILVCELSNTENDDDLAITNAYEADVIC